MSSWTGPHRSLGWGGNILTSLPPPLLTVSQPFSARLYLRLPDVSPLTQSPGLSVNGQHGTQRLLTTMQPLRQAISRLLPYTPRTPVSGPPRRHSGWIKLLLIKFLLDVHPTRPPIFLQEENFHKLQNREGFPLWTQLPEHTSFRKPTVCYKTIFLIFSSLPPLLGSKQLNSKDCMLILTTVYWIEMPGIYKHF